MAGKWGPGQYVTSFMDLTLVFLLVTYPRLSQETLEGDERRYTQ